MATNNIDEILDFAIEKEEEANQFYTDLAQKMDNPAMKKVFEDFAREERGHKAKLEAVKRGEFAIGSDEAIASLDIGDYLGLECHPFVYFFVNLNIWYKIFILIK